MQLALDGTAVGASWQTFFRIHSALCARRLPYVGVALRGRFWAPSGNLMTMSAETVLVTGASSGIGLELGGRFLLRHRGQQATEERPPGPMTVVMGVS